MFLLPDAEFPTLKHISFFYTIAGLGNFQLPKFLFPFELIFHLILLLLSLIVSLEMKKSTLNPQHTLRRFILLCLLAF